ncbi:hypothetical protein H7I76_32435 [Mycolicibacterium vaccae]|nr:hypothetical protein [Mycolicibacterium vaccae]
MTVAMVAEADSTSRHVEVERKFDVAESTMLPSFAGLAAVTRIENSRR